MAFAITKSCCADAACVSVCPVGCIHPAPGEPGFGTSEILHIDPATCIDCGACADACPVDAIYPVDRLVGADREYGRINAAYFATPHPTTAPTDSTDDVSTGVAVADPSELAERAAPSEPTDPAEPTSWSAMPPRGHVAVVGAGASGSYTVKELLARTDARITVIDALPTPGGLIRSGVAADHPATKRIQRTFDLALRHRRVTLAAGVELGRDVTLEDLRERFDAVFIATGANVPRVLGVPGEGHPRVRQAREVVAWAGGLPDAEGITLDTATDGTAGRVVIVGAGNVALDIARLFALPLDALARTDVADRALDALRTNPMRDVVVLARGDADGAAYTQAEFRALLATPGIDVRVVDADAPWQPGGATDVSESRVTLLFGSTVREIEDGEQVGAAPRARVVVDRAGVDTLTLDADLVVTSLGQDVGPLDTLPLDPVTRAVRHDAGRVNGMPGVYVVGWAKRGALGGIGANRPCAAETVASYLEDAPALAAPARRATELERLARSRGAHVVTLRGAQRIDRAEVRAGAASGRPRVKITSRDALLDAAAGRFSRR